MYVFFFLPVDAYFMPFDRGYNGGAMVNYGKVVFRGEVMVRDNTAVMDGGGFINE